MLLLQFFNKFGLLGILCSIFTAYSIANHLNVNFSIFMIWIREESSDLAVFRRGFFFLLRLGKAAVILLWPSSMLPGPSI